MLPPWQKRRFCWFLHFRHGGNVIFRIFHSSEASETLFFSFFAHPRPRTDKKPWNLALTTRRKTENPGWRFAGKQSPPRFRTMRSVGTGKISAKEMSEQIGVCAGINEMQNKSPGVLQPNQQPVHVWYISWTIGESVWYILSHTCSGAFHFRSCVINVQRTLDTQIALF